MQRKPSERLGLRGAAEVKDHAWIKYYPWKDLYDKKIESGFIPKSGMDHWDKRYCEAPDKIGVETKERYEKHLRNESTHEIFKNYYYFGFDEFPDRVVEKVEKVEKTPTTSNKSLANLRDKKYSNSISSSIQLNKDTLEHSSSNVKMKVIDKSQPSQSIDARITKLKKLSVSSSNSSLLRQYKQQSSNLSNNSTGSGNTSNASMNFAKQRSASTVNLSNK